jgi:hypothetical protein
MLCAAENLSRSRSSAQGVLLAAGTSLFLLSLANSLTDTAVAAGVGALLLALAVRNKPGVDTIIHVGHWFMYPRTGALKPNAALLLNVLKAVALAVFQPVRSLQQ